MCKQIYDVFVDWEMNLFCNFDCPYCYFHSRRYIRDRRCSGHSVKRIMDVFSNGTENWLIHMSGGEPFLHPDFIELCARVAQRHYISVNTNLSTQKVYDFADNIDPRKVARLHASLHITQRNGLDDFVRRIRYLNARGFSVDVSQVMYPPILRNFERTFQLLKENGIVTRPKVFRGSYGMKRYPQGYTEGERQLFMRYFVEGEKNQDSSRNPDLGWLFSCEKNMLGGELSFKGIACCAGKNYFYVRYNGDVLRCIRGRKIGNIFRDQIGLDMKPLPCKSEICFCPHFGLRYAKGEPSVKNLRLQGLKMRLYNKAFDWKENAKYILHNHQRIKQEN